MEDILEKAKKVAEEAEVFAVTSESTPVHFEANRLKHVQSTQSTSVALRIIREGRIGYATATELENSQELVDMAVETARFGSKAEFEFPSLSSYPEVEIFDSGVEKISTGAMTKLGEEMITALISNTPELLCEAAVSKGVVSVRLINSRGGQTSYRQSFFSLGIEGTLIQDTDMLFVGDSQSSCRPIVETGGITQVVLRQLELARNQASAPTRLMPVVFTSLGVASALVRPLMAAFNGKMVLEGASPIGDKLGQRVFDEKLELWDDSTLAYRPSSSPFDDEGVPAQRTSLIEKGVVRNFLYDLQTAALANTRSTGNGQRSRGGLPTPSPSAFIIAPGKTGFDEMVSDIKEGLVVEELMGATQGNILGGDFSGNVLLGFKIENGKIVGRVKDTMVSGNIYQLLKEITAIGSDARWVGSSLNTPPLYLSSVSVASK
ncbi:MAG: metallopeptidase TldD-related protein [Dehalococcoidales bacterium]|nr:metallopeptidase TldD-related protein [Dehalococcoidales bacterium]